MRYSWLILDRAGPSDARTSYRPPRLALLHTDSEHTSLEFATGRVGFGEAWLGFFLVHANLDVPRSLDLVKYTCIPVPWGEYDPVLECAIVN